VFGGATFALDVTARNFSGRIHLLFEVAGEWEEVDAFARFLGGGNGREDHIGVAVANQRAAVCLLRQFAGLDDQRATADLE
jgi:hypothetical protein